VIAWTAFWYFEHYPAFTGSLDGSARRVIENDRLIVLDLAVDAAQ
jgi:hypothetical protein